ncbi:MAG: hypothetical protein RL027_7 [Pseudomonadota bacterium]|jgi:hypothetical protein
MIISEKEYNLLVKANKNHLLIKPGINADWIYCIYPPKISELINPQIFLINNFFDKQCRQKIEIYAFRRHYELKRDDNMYLTDFVRNPRTKKNY